MEKTKDTKTLLLDYTREALEKDNFSEVYFGYAEPLPDVPTPLNFLSRIAIPIEGEVLMQAAYDGKIGMRKLSPGQILFTGRNGWAASAHKSSHISSISIVFMENYIRFVYGELHYKEILFNPWYHTSHGPGRISSNILDCLNEIMFETDTNRNERAIPLIKALLYQVLEEAKRDSNVKMSKSEKTFRHIIEYTQQYYHFPINRASVCNELNLSPSLFSRVFREYSEQNFNAYLNELRMKKAELILRNYGLTVEKIADQCGFTSSGYFIKAFKKYFGTTPEVFRNLNK